MQATLKFVDRPMPDRVATIRTLAEQGLTQSDIARRLGATSELVHRTCKQNGIAFKDGRSGDVHAPSSISVWDMSEDDRRQAFAKRAAEGARQALRAAQ